jgi:hypothetical protein
MRDRHVPGAGSVRLALDDPLPADIIFDLTQIASRAKRGKITSGEGTSRTKKKEDVMPDYRVAFYKTVLSSDGHPSKCLQECIDIHDLQDPTGAARAATQAFQERHGTQDWRVHADMIDVTLLPAGVLGRGRRCTPETPGVK